MLSFSGFYVKDQKIKRIDQTELKSVQFLVKPLKYENMKVCCSLT